MTASSFSQYFTLSEFLHSPTALRMGRPQRLSVQSPEAQNLQRLARTILDPLRQHLNRPLNITSGYRSPWLNRQIGGSPNSQHVLGQAADVQSRDHHPLTLCQIVQTLDLPFDQLIHEFGGWMHVSVAPRGRQPRKQVLTAKKIGRKTVYLSGLHPV